MCIVFCRFVLAFSYFTQHVLDRISTTEQTQELWPPWKALPWNSIPISTFCESFIRILYIIWWATNKSAKRRRRPSLKFVAIRKQNWWTGNNSTYSWMIGPC